MIKILILCAFNLCKKCLYALKAHMLNALFSLMKSDMKYDPSCFIYKLNNPFGDIHYLRIE